MRENEPAKQCVVTTGDCCSALAVTYKGDLSIITDGLQSAIDSGVIQITGDAVDNPNDVEEVLLSLDCEYLKVEKVESVINIELV